MEAHYIKPDEGCKGYWRCSAICSDGSVVLATADSEAWAITETKIELEKREAFLRLPDTDRLKVLLDGDLLSTDSKAALKIIGKLVLILCDRFGSEPR